MVNITIYLDYSNMVDFLLMPIISSWVIMLTEENKAWKLYAFFSPTRLSIPRTSSYSEETTNAHQSTVSMDFMMNASVVTTSNCGKLSLIASTACLSLLSLTRKFFVCMEDFPRNSAPLTKLRESWDLLMCLILVFSAISYGPIPTKMYKVGVKTTEV